MRHTHTHRAKDTQLTTIRSRLDECASSFVVSTTPHAPAETMDALMLRQRTSLTTLNDPARAFVVERLAGKKEATVNVETLTNL